MSCRLKIDQGWHSSIIWVNFLIEIYIWYKINNKNNSHVNTCTNIQITINDVLPFGCLSSFFPTFRTMNFHSPSPKLIKAVLLKDPFVQESKGVFLPPFLYRFISLYPCCSTSVVSAAHSPNQVALVAVYVSKQYL